MASKFPFGYLAKMELSDLHGLDLPSQLQLLPSHELRSKLSHIPSLDNFDLDETISRQSIISMLTYQISLFDLNTRSLSKNFDQLQNVLSATKTKFDLIGITETKQKINKDFITNVSISIHFSVCFTSCRFH